MDRNKPSIDGFIPRRPGAQLGETHSATRSKNVAAPIDRTLKTTEDGAVLSGSKIGEPRQGKGIGRGDIDESLREIDDIDGGKRGKRRRKNDSGDKRPKSKVKRILLIALVVVLFGAALVAGYLVFKGVSAGNKIFDGNILDIVQNQPLKQDANGRSNFVIFGTAEDDEGGEHGGANLTDSIMVVSIDQNKKNGYMLSLPRDLWVQYVMPDNEVCAVGYQGKLNAQYFCASNDGANEAAGAQALQQKVGDITGLDIQYYVHLNFTAVVEAVDAIGGVDVTIESSDPRGILDRNFDWKCRYQCYFVNYTNGQQVHLDGEHALALARARNAAGGYGLPNGNFDREKNQQMIIKAIQQKAVSAGTLTNLGAVTGLIDALGNNLRTNVQTKEIRTLMDLGTKISADSLVSLTLNDPENLLVTTGSHNGQSIVRPVAGLTDYSEIQAYIEKEISSDPFVKEEPHVTVLNGTGTAGVAQTLADQLTDEGFIIDQVDNAPEGEYEAVVIYQMNTEKTATATKLQDKYGVKIKPGPPPFSVVGETDFVIIIGHSSIITANQ